jgi:hypothetical protein
MPARRSAVHAKPEEPVEPILSIGGGSRISLAPAEIAGVQDSDRQQPAVVPHDAPARPQAVWAPFPLEATSKASLYIQAERIPDAALMRLLAERLA